MSRKLHVIKEVPDVYGVTSLEEELYILLRREICHSISVYSISDFTFLRHISVSELSQYGVKHITASVQLQCLLIADRNGQCVHKITTDGNKEKQATWALYDKPWGISVSGDLVIVTCGEEGIFFNTGKLIELNSDGYRLREIVLRPSINSIRNAVKHPQQPGKFIVCYEGGFCAKDGTIAIVDSNGEVQQSYGNWWIPRETPLLRWACCLAVDGDGFVFVADKYNDRILLLNPSLQFVRSIPTGEYPMWLHFDQKSRRLVVVCWSNVVSVFQLCF